MRLKATKTLMDLSAIFTLAGKYRGEEIKILRKTQCFMTSTYFVDSIDTSQVRTHACKALEL